MGKVKGRKKRQEDNPAFAAKSVIEPKKPSYESAEPLTMATKMKF